MISKYLLVIIFIFYSQNIFAQDRSDLETKNKVFLEDIEKIGNFQKIDYAPKGMFDPKFDQFIKRVKFSQDKVGLIFVKQKSLMDKNPENLMLGMAYFEFFYQDQLKKSSKDLKKFKTDYPNVKSFARKTAQKMYGLNKARTAMRNALGYELDDDIKNVLDGYYTLHKLFLKGKKISFKLNKEEKKNYKFHTKLTENIGKVKTLLEDRSDQRINEKEFGKKYKKLEKKIVKNMNYLTLNENYKILDEYLKKIFFSKTQNLELTLHGIYVSEFFLNEIKSQKLKKKYQVDLTNADFTSFSEDELKSLAELSSSSKIQKIKKNENIQRSIFFLKNNNIDVDETIDLFNNNNVVLSSLNVKFESVDTMKRWAMKDWANAWTSPIPEKIEDNNKNLMINLSEEDIVSLKAQLSIQYFQEIIGNDLIGELNDGLSEITNELSNNDFNFSYNLDDYAKYLGDTLNIDIKNYADLTALANDIYNEDWSVEEYSSAYQGHVDAINALAAGTSAFTVAEVAQSLGASLQDVADTIAAASAAGVSVDLEAAASGLGYGSFAEAVEAYNEQHGTNYSTQEAKEALGQ